MDLGLRELVLRSNGKKLLALALLGGLFRPTSETF